VSALETLIRKLKRPHVFAECEQMREINQMHFFQLATVHLECRQVHEADLFELIEFDGHDPNSAVVLEPLDLEMFLDAVDTVRNKQGRGYVRTNVLIQYHFYTAPSFLQHFPHAFACTGHQKHATSWHNVTDQVVRHVEERTRSHIGLHFFKNTMNC
jgi:hypothetical protein